MPLKRSDLALVLVLMGNVACGADSPPSASQGATADAGASATSDASAVDASATTDGTSDGAQGAPSTCTPPPDLSFDPLSSYAPSKLVATAVVTSALDTGPGSLGAVLDAAPDGAVVGFDPALSGQTIRLHAPITLRRSVTLDGLAAPGLTIDGQDATALFTFNGDAPTRIVFRMLRLVHGHSTGAGGAIGLNGASLDVEIAGCRFESNAANEGGAVRVGYAKGSTVSIHDSVFVGNDSSVGGGDGFSGGAISAIGTNLHVARCRFDGNTGPTVGALYTIHSDPIVEDSVFVQNHSSRTDGGTGAFGADGGGPGDDNNPGTVPGKVTLRRVRFESNAGAAADGGAAAIWGYPEDTITIEDAVFRGNRCANGAKGGALRLHARAAAMVERVAFVRNVSTDQGGGVWFDGEGPVTFRNALFAANEAQGDRGGGATFNSGTVNLVHVTFFGNVSGQGTPAFFQSGDATVHAHNTIVASNRAMNNAYEGQTGRPVVDEEGNLEWPAPPDDAHRVAAGDQIADPLLQAPEEMDGTTVAVLGASSPALGAAAPPVAMTDQRGAPRPARADSGSWQSGAACGK